MVVLLSLACAVACVSGSADDTGTNGPECYTNADCQAGHECSGGICVGYNGCGNGCRNNEDCLDNVCRLQCTKLQDCEEEGLLCGSDTQHCKPKPNPTRSQTQTQSGTGGNSSGSGGSGTGAAGHPGAGSPGSAGSPAAAGSPAMPTAGRSG
jgi:hypothetical protein